MIDDLVRDIADFAQVGAHKLKERIWDTGFYSLVVQDSHEPNAPVKIECRVQGEFYRLPEYVQEYLADKGKTSTMEEFGFFFQTAATEFAGVRVVITGAQKI